ncbi:MAG: histidine kinase [Clostridium sp.]
MKWEYIVNRVKYLVAAGILLNLIQFAIIFVQDGGNSGLKIISGIILGVLLILLYLGYSTVYRPFIADRKVKQVFARGDSFSDIFEMPYKFSEADEGMLRRFVEMLDTKEIINVSKKQAEYLALQNQINPHFLYNTLEGIRSEALMAGVDSIAEMTEALSTFFRYTISQVNNLVTLEDELANIENYYYIQQFRFGDKLELSIEYVHDDDTDEADILTYRLPKLTLQPVVENSIYHGIEEKIGKGHLRIRITATKENLIIKVSDDGMGIDDEKLKRLNYKLRALTLDDVNPKVSTKGGIAIMNVNNRIKLLFGEKYGVHIYSQPGVGTDVEITLPIVIE